MICEPKKAEFQPIAKYSQYPQNSPEYNLQCLMHFFLRILRIVRIGHKFIFVPFSGSLSLVVSMVRPAYPLCPQGTTRGCRGAAPLRTLRPLQKKYRG